jgi:hypothetical protein
MNRTKLAVSIEAFKQFYLVDREYYDKDERGWKVDLSERFQQVFALENVTGESYLDSLKALFEDPSATQTIIWLGGGAYYQHRRFLDLLQSEPNETVLSELFRDLLYSQAPVGARINRFKGEIDALYKDLLSKGTIQLNLISQFLGLRFPHRYYIYKYTEFNQAVSYFEYSIRPANTSTGGQYEYYLEFSQEIKSAMHEAGLHEVDFIDVQTFVFRRDWYTPADSEQEKDKFEDETAEQESLSIERLVDHVRGSDPRPIKIVRGLYYYRNPNVAALVKKDAQGVCDLCGKAAPFKNRKNKPYLENHHIVYLADGGEDRVENCATLCPNCHAKMHILNLESDKERLIAVARKRYERLFLT